MTSDRQTSSHDFVLVSCERPRGGSQLGPLLQEALHGAHVPRADGAVQGPHTVRVHALHLRPAVQEELRTRKENSLSSANSDLKMIATTQNAVSAHLNDFWVALVGGEEEGRAPLLVRPVEVGALVEEALRRLHAPLQARPAEGCHPVAVPGVD